MWCDIDMKLATFRQPNFRTDQPGATFVAIITETDVDYTGAEDAVHGVMIPEVRDVGEFLALPPTQRAELIDRAETEGEVWDISEATFDTLIPYPSKIFCVGLNYRNHIAETGFDTPEYPTIFAKFAQSLTGADARIAVPQVDHRLDYEGELCVVIGKPGRNIPVEEASDYIAGYAIANDVSLRGYQGRTREWTQGKIFEASTPIGPWLLTADEFNPDARLTTAVNNEIVQNDLVSDVVFSPAELVSYLSEIITLLPGDLILTGTPEGIAQARRNAEGCRPWLKAGDTVEVRIDGLGVQRNVIV